MQMSKFINLLRMTPSINFHLHQLSLISAKNSIIFLNTSRSYYPHLANQSTLLKIPKNSFENLEKLFHWTVIKKYFFSFIIVYQSATRFHHIYILLRQIYRVKEFLKKYIKSIKETAINLFKKCPFFFYWITLSVKRWCNKGVPIRTCHSWHFYG